MQEHTEEAWGHAGEYGQLDKGRECQNHQQRSGDRLAYAAPPQRGAHEETVITRIRCHSARRWVACKRPNVAVFFARASAAGEIEQC